MRKGKKITGSGKGRANTQGDNRGKRKPLEELEIIDWMVGQLWLPLIGCQEKTQD